MIIAHWITYNGDSDVLPLSVAAFRRAVPEARLVIIDDAHNPCKPSTCKACLDMGVEWRYSHWDRQGNLRGPACISGIFSEYVRSIIDGAGIVVKVDPDTVVLGRQWLDDFIESGAGLTAGDDRGYMYGCCYAMRADIATELRESFRDRPAQWGGEEDIMIAHRLQYINPGQFRRIPMWSPQADSFGNGPQGIMTAYNWVNGLDSDRIRRYARDFEIINCGNLVPAGGGRKRLMQRLCKTVATRLH